MENEQTQDPAHRCIQRMFCRLSYPHPAGILAHPAGCRHIGCVVCHPSGSILGGSVLPDVPGGIPLRTHPVDFWVDGRLGLGQRRADRSLFPASLVQETPIPDGVPYQYFGVFPGGNCRGSVLYLWLAGVCAGSAGIFVSGMSRSAGWYCDCSHAPAHPTAAEW